MSEFERQLSSRLEAMQFLLMAVIRGQFAQATPDEVQEQVGKLKKQFSSAVVPEDADLSEVDLDRYIQDRQDAQFFLDRFLDQANPHHSL